MARASGNDRVNRRAAARRQRSRIDTDSGTDTPEEKTTIPRIRSYTMAAVSATTPSRFLVVGLGNTTHPNTRHNVGFMAIDHILRVIAHSLQLAPDASLASRPPWVQEKAAGGHIFECFMSAAQASALGVRSPAMLNGWQETGVVLLKPKGFMNLSGSAIRQTSRIFAIPPSNIIIIHDDLERKFGQVSVKNGGSAVGHNGLRSAAATLGTTEFRRVRVGIDRPASRDPDVISDYVLQKFSDEELSVLNTMAFPAAAKAVAELIGAGPMQSKEPNNARL